MIFRGELSGEKPVAFATCRGSRPAFLFAACALAVREFSRRRTWFDSLTILASRSKIFTGLFTADARDDEAMTAFAMRMAALGNIRTQTLRAFPSMK